MRNAGAIDTTHDLAAADHVCWTYSSDDEYRAVLSSFFAEGLDRGERIALFAPATKRELLPGRIGGHDIRTLVESDRLVVLAAEDALQADGHIDHVTSLRKLEEIALASSAVDGHTGLRVAIEAGWLMELGPSERFTRFEFRADLLAESAPLTALCCYDSRMLDPGAIALARSLHPLRLGLHGPDARFTMTSAGSGVVAIAGEIDCVHAETVGSLLEDCAPQIRTLDLTGLEFADVTALRALAFAAECIAFTHGDVRLRGASPTFRRMWELLHLSERVSVSFD